MRYIIVDICLICNDDSANRVSHLGVYNPIVMPATLCLLLPRFDEHINGPGAKPFGLKSQTSLDPFSGLP